MGWGRVMVRVIQNRLKFVGRRITGRGGAIGPKAPKQPEVEPLAQGRSKKSRKSRGKKGSN